jgi:hypothetical protein
MSTVPCPSCGHGVAIDAKRCPGCGGQISLARLLVHHRPRLAAVIFAGCLAFFSYCWWSCTHQP